MKKDIFATNNEFLKCKESESSQKQEHFSQWKPICDTIHTNKNVIKQITKIHTLEGEEEQEECMKVRAREEPVPGSVSPRGRWSPEAAKSKRT